MRYKAYVSIGTKSGIADAAVRAPSGRPMSPAAEKLALRHARAMKAVLIAAKAWTKAATALEIAYERDVHVSAGAPIAQRHLDATKRLLDAQDRLAKIEKEVSRG